MADEVFEHCDVIFLCLPNSDVASRVLGVVRSRERVGTATGLDVAQQETLVSQLRAQVPPVQQAIEANRNALAVLAGRSPAGVVSRRKRTQ